MRVFIPATLLVATVFGGPLKQRADTDFQVTDFSAAIAAHSTQQVITFNVAPPSEDAVSCSSTISASIGASPKLATVTDGECASGSGLTFNFSQGDDYSVTLEVQTEDGTAAGYTSPTDSVAFERTGTKLTDFGTSYTGSSSFALAVSQ